MKKAARIALFAVLALCCAAKARGQEAAGYVLKPPALAAPGGAPGAVRRVIMQFYHWTLLCDEIIAQKRRVCNVTQTVHDASDNTIFSWSLAGSDDGKPFLLLRALPQADTGKPFRLLVKSTGRTAEVPFVGCNEALCMGQTPVGPILTQGIKDESDIVLSYQLTNGGAAELVLPLQGLRAAVAAIDVN